MKRIEIDEEVYQALLKLVRSFEDTPNDVLRRLLGLDEVHEEQQETETVIKAEKDYERPIKEMMTSLGLKEGREIVKEEKIAPIIRSRPIHTQQLLDVIEKIESGFQYRDACKSVAEKHGVTPSTIYDACTRRIGLNTN